MRRRLPEMLEAVGAVCVVIGLVLLLGAWAGWAAGGVALLVKAGELDAERRGVRQPFRLRRGVPGGDE